ncbi:serine hydrolase [Rhodococcus sp. 3Y1]
MDNSEVQGGDSDGTVSITSTTGGAFDVNVVVDGNGLILGMAITPTKDVHVPAASWQELEAAVKALPAPTNLTVTEVTEGKNAEVFSVGDTSPQPTGSTIKLYVLGAVATAVQNGTLSWDQKLTITDDLKSMPGGTMQDLPSGTEVTVRDAAGKMISISDNTATDMLIAAVGREQVEAEFAPMGMANPSLNIPLKPTRALFQLGWGDQGAQRIAWRDGTPDERRAILAALPDGLVDIPASAFTTPHGLSTSIGSPRPPTCVPRWSRCKRRRRPRAAHRFETFSPRIRRSATSPRNGSLTADSRAAVPSGSSRVPITWNTTIVPGLSPCKLMVTTLHWLPTRLCTSIRSTTRCS